jgi:uroporphyrinogen-III decarboxylase
MTDNQWKDLIDIVNGKILKPLPIGFIIDSPWIPGWYGITILDYFTSDEMWFESNCKVLQTFPDIMFFPGFWSEYGMCSEPSAFGSRCTFPLHQFPHAHTCLYSIEDIAHIQKPVPGVDGLSAFLLHRLKRNRQRIEDTGHRIRFSVSRGHLNIASYLLGTQELMTGMLTHPDRIHTLLRIITDYLIEWHDLQKDTFPSIDGIMILDDMIGFIGEEEFKQFGLPYLKALYDKDVSIKFFHNDADCHVSLPYLPQIGINLFNMGFDTSLQSLKDRTDNKVAMMGNIPPRDVLAGGTDEEIEKTVCQLIDSLNDLSQIIVSCGGGMPPDVSTEHIMTFIRSVRDNT